MRLLFAASLLQLRGSCSVHVPHLDPAGSGDCLCFNGEVFGGLHMPHGSNDGQELLQALMQTSDVPGLLSRLRGPWSVLYWRQSTQTLWFGRDFMGRRSLLVHLPLSEKDQLTLTSVAPPPSLTNSSDSSSNAVTAAACTQGTEPSSSMVLLAQQPVGPLTAEQHAPADVGNGYSHSGTNSSLEGLHLGSLPFPNGHRQQGRTGEDGEEGGEEEGGAGAGQDPAAFWQELPPGIYSLEMGLSREGPPDPPTARDQGGKTGEGEVGVPTQGHPADAASAAATADAGHSGVVSGKGSFADDDNGSAVQSSRQAGVKDGRAETERHAVANSRRPTWPPTGGDGAAETAAGVSDWLGAHGLRLQAHAWSDPHIARLHAYDKAAAAGSGGLAPQRPPAPALPSPDPSSEGRPLNCSDPGCLESTSTSSSPSLATPSPATGVPLSPPRAPATWDLDSAVEALLVALQAAIDVRCRCLDIVPSSPTHPATPHPGHLDPPGVQQQPGTTLPAASPSPPIMILFSGGVDSVLLAALAHRSLPPDVPIDLCNVCFDGGRSPDRLAAHAALSELAGWAPARDWRLVEVDATLEDTFRHREHLLSLLHPAGTVMDLNIGAALWLAASGTGRLCRPCVGEPAGAAGPRSSLAQGGNSPASAGEAGGVQGYCSPARVVLLGHGADEQCAGYGRHRTRFRHGGLAALSAELSLDVTRMWLRNCGRDDRLVADRGREARHPFLDEGFMALLLELPLHCIADLRQAPGLGDKKILRQALLRLGLPKAAARVKRAIQFGSRIGKLSNRQEFGSNRAANRANAGSLALTALPQNKQSSMK